MKANAASRTKTPKPKRLLAIDTSASPGFAVIEYGANKPPILIYTDAFPTDTSLTDAERFEVVRSATALICYKYGSATPFDVVVREHFIKGGSKRGTQLVFGGWAAVDMALKAFGYAISEDDELTPGEVKKALTGKGTAPKTRKEAEERKRKGKSVDLEFSVEDGVRLALDLPEDFEFPNNKGGDSSDSCAVGIAYLKREGAIE